MSLILLAEPVRPRLYLQKQASARDKTYKESVMAEETIFSKNHSPGDPVGYCLSG